MAVVGRDGYAPLADGNERKETEVKIPEQIDGLLGLKLSHDTLRDEINRLTKKTYTDRSYRDFLDASADKVAELKTTAPLAAEALEKKRQVIVNLLTDFQVEHKPTEGGCDSFVAEAAQNYVALASETAYAYFMFDMLRISASVFLTQLCQLENLSEDDITKYSAMTAGLVFLANILGYDAMGEARDFVKGKIDNPRKTIGSIMKRNPWLAAAMLKHFFDGAYSDVIQLADVMSTPSFLLVSIPCIAAAMKYYLTYSGADVMKAEEQWKKHPSILSHLGRSLANACAHVARCEFKAAGSDLLAAGGDSYRLLLETITVVNRMALFAYSGFREPQQMAGVGGYTDPLHPAITWGSAGISAIATYQPAQNTRALALRNQFYNPDISEAKYAEATLAYENRTVCQKLWGEVSALCLSPSTFMNTPVVYLSVKSAQAGDYLTSGGLATLAAIMHLCYREARKMQDVTSIAGKEDTRHNWFASACSLFLTASDQLSRVGSTAVAGLTFAVGDYFGDFNLEKIKSAPKASTELLLAIYCLGSIVAAGNMPYALQKMAKTLLSKSDTLFGRRVLEKAAAVATASAEPAPRDEARVAAMV